MSKREIDVTIRVKTQNIIIQESKNEEELPLRKWRVEICMLNSKGEEVPANFLYHCIYYLHKSFLNPIRKIDKAPFVLEEEGWGEFDMKIVCSIKRKGGKFTIYHDLSFEDDAFAVDYNVQVQCHIPVLRELLSQNFELPELEEEQICDPKYKRNWRKEFQKMDEDMITDFTHIILNDPAVRNEIDRYDRTERVHLYFGQFPIELQEKLYNYMLQLASVKKGITREEITETEDDDDIFGDKLSVVQ